MKILVVFTGGTIGCVRKGEVLSPDNEQKYMLTQMYLDSLIPSSAKILRAVT
jgi:hypothetical protein